MKGNNRRRSKSTKATSKRPKRKGAFLSKSTSSLSTVYNSNYRSVYEQKTSVSRRKVRYGKRGKKSVKSPRGNAASESRNSTFLTSLLSSTDDEEVCSNTLAGNNLSGNSAILKEKNTHDNMSLEFRETQAYHKREKKNKENLRSKNNKNCSKNKPSKFGLQSSTFLTASLFEPFDDSDFDLESPIKTKECPTKADGLNKILVDDLSYLPHDRRLKQKKKGDDNEEVVDASGGLTTSLNSIHKGVHSANIRGGNATRKMLGLSSVDQFRSSKRQAWMSKSVLKQRDINTSSAPMALRKSRGFHSLGTKKTIKQGRRKQWSAGNGSNMFQSYASSGAALSNVTNRASRKRYNHSRGVLTGIRRISR